MCKYQQIFSPKNKNETRVLPKKAANLVLLIYLLFLLAPLFGITAIIAILINHSQYKQQENAVVKSHLKWQIISFWMCFILAVCAFSISDIDGIYLITSAVLWIYYRSFKGLYYLRKNQPPPIF